MNGTCTTHRRLLIDGGCPDCFDELAARDPGVARNFAGRWYWAAASATFARVVGALVSFAFVVFVVATIAKAWSK